MMQFTNDVKIGEAPYYVPRTYDEMQQAIETHYIIPSFRHGKLTVDKMLDHADVVLEWYIPSEYSIDFMNFMRLVLGEEPENSNPKAHYFMIDCIFKEECVRPYFDVRGIDYDMLKDRVLVLCTREFSKALTLDTKLATPSGYVKMKNIKKNDIVIDRNGKPTLVTSKSGLFFNNTYKITLSDGRIIETSYNHDNIIWKRKNKRISRKYTKGIGDQNIRGLEEKVMTTEEIYRSGFMFNKTITNNQKKGSEYKYFIPRMNNPIEFNSCNFPIDPYTVGVILGDGSIDKNTGFTRITCHKDDFEIYEKNIPYKIGTKYEKKDSNAYFFSLLGIGKLVKEHIGTEIVYYKRIPKPLLTGSVNERIAVLQGLMDTDGSINKKGSASFSSTSKGLVEDVLEIVRSLGGTGTISKRKTNSTFGISYWIGIKINNIKLFKHPRKLERQTYIPARDMVGIENIELIHSVPTQCITVESDTKSFILENGIVTHNSTLLGSMLVLYMAAHGELPGFGKVNYMLYVSDSMRNNVKTTMDTIKQVYYESAYLQSIFESVRLVQDEVNFVRNPVTKKEIAVYKQYVEIEGKPKDQVPGRMKRTFSMSGLGASALSLDSVLYNSNGWTNIEECKIGDKIIGNDGKLTTIVEKSNIFNRSMYEIELYDGRKIKVCEEHINNIYTKKVITTRKDGIRKRHTEWVENNIITSDLIDMNIYKTKADNKRQNLLFIKNNESLILPEQKFDLDPYTLGILLGDGHFSSDGSIRLEGLDEDVNHYLTITSEKISNISIVNRNRDGKKYRKLLRIGFKDLYKKTDILKLRGIYGKDKFVPDVYLAGSEEERLLLLQGLMDTDGHIKKKGTVRFDSISIGLIEAVQYLVRSLGGTANAYTIQNRSNIGWSDLYSVTIRLEKFNPFSLPRKANEYIVGKAYTPYTAILSIKKIKTEPSMCIGVDNASHLFLSGSNRLSFTITHNTGGRGSRDGLARPNGVFFDDLLGSEVDAESDTILENVESTIESDILPALSGNGSFKIFAGTPYNKKDPAYSRIEDGSWLPVVFPKAEKMDDTITEDNFRGVWPDRHSYATCKGDYLKAKRAADNGKETALRKLNQEYYLRISSDEDRLVPDRLIQWYSRQRIVENAWAYNWYVTTDYTSTGKKGSDLSGGALWAIDSNSNHFLVDLILRRMELETQYRETFNFVKQCSGITRGIEVGVETDGQQGIHIYALKERMAKEAVFFTIARQKGQKLGSEGIRSKLEGGNKHWRFRMMLPYFQNKKIWFPDELKGSEDMNELLNEIKYTTYTGFGATHDDGNDILSQLIMMDINYPPPGLEAENKPRVIKNPMNAKIWGKKNEVEDESNIHDSYA